MVYLSVVDHWQVYAEPVRQAQKWFLELGYGEPLPVDGSASGSGGQGEGISGGENTSGPEAAEEGKDLEAGNMGSNAGGESDSGDSGGNPGEGSGNSGREFGEATGSGNSGSGVGEATGSGNSGRESGEATGSGNSGSSAGEATGSGNSGSGAGEATGSGNTGNVPGVPIGSGNSSDGQGALPQVEYQTVEDDYFSDALFIGDSRTMGLFEYGGLETVSTFYASTGLTVYKMFDTPVMSVPGVDINVEEGLQQNHFGKIYLMIGINEMGAGTVESFLEKYQEAVAHIRELQPDAVIYLQAIIKVTAERSAQGDYINNEGIIARNEGIAKMADNEKVFFLDVNPEICDESGGMNPEYTFDGVHLKAKYIQIWKDYLKSHAIFS